MKEEEPKEPEKQPIEMTTEEALDYIFAPEIAKELRKQAKSREPDDDSESE
jgi:hypothetical protein